MPTAIEAITKYGQNEEGVLIFAVLLLFLSKLSIDSSEFDTFVGLVQSILGAPYALYFLETVATSESITMFTDRLNLNNNFETTTISELLTVIADLAENVNESSTITENITIKSGFIPTVKDIVTATENITVAEV